MYVVEGLLPLPLGKLRLHGGWKPSALAPTLRMSSNDHPTRSGPPPAAMSDLVYTLLGLTIAIFAVIGVAVLAAVVTVMAIKPIRERRQADRLARCCRDFHRQREQLEAKFIQRAAATGKPRGLRWVDVDFDDDVFYARDRRSRGLKALVAIEVAFEAIEGGGMEEVEAVSNIRAATAEFLHDGTRWATEGRVYFNLLPDAAVKYLSNDLELVAEDHV